MLQRQIMLKQMQEMQRRQQIQELGDTRNQTYVNQLSSRGQFPHTVNGTPVHASPQMFMLGSMQMMQHGGSNVVPRLPDGFVLQQNQHQSLGPSLGLSQPQFSSLYGTPTPNIDKNLNQYSHFQEPSGISGNPLTKNNNSPLGMSSIQPSVFGSSFMDQRGNFSSDQIDMQDGSFQSGQVFQEKNLVGQVPVQSVNSGTLSGSYSNLGTTVHRNFPQLESEGRHDCAAWHGDSRGNESKFDLSQPAASLDPLEQKILFNTDDNNWESFSRNGKLETGGLESTVEHTSYMDEFPSMQSGSWSALMQSAVAETSSCNTGIQEEWSGLSLQNPEPSTDNQPSNLIDSERPQSYRADRNLLNIFSSNSKPEQLFQSPNTRSMFPGFLQTGNQQKHDSSHFQSETFHASTQHSPRNMSQSSDHDAQHKHPIVRNQLIQTSLSSTSIWPGQHNEQSNNNDNKPHNYFSGDNGNEARGSLWLHESTTHQMAGGFQKQYDQANHPSINNKMALGNNVEPMSTLLGASSDFHGQNLTARSENVLELFNRDAKSNDYTSSVQLNLEVSTPNDLPLTESSSLTKSSNTPLSRGFSFPLGLADNQTPQPYSFFPSLSMGNSSVATISSHNINDYIKNQDSPSTGHMGTKSAPYGPAASQDNSQSKTIHSSGLEFSLLENMPVSQPSPSAVVPENVGFSLGSPTQWSNMKTRQDTPLQKSRSNLFRSPDSATNSGASKLPIQNSFRNEINALESRKWSGQSEYHQELMEGSSDHKGSTEKNHSTLLSSTRPNKQESSDAVASVMHQMPSIQAEQRHDEAPAFLARDIGAFGHSLKQNSSISSQTESGIDYQNATGDARDLFLRGQNVVVKDISKINLDGERKLSSLWSGKNNDCNFSQQDLVHQSGKASSTDYLQNLQTTNMLGQNDSQNHYMGSEASNVTYQSQISLQMAPSWFKLHGNLKDGQMLPLSNPQATLKAAQPFSGMAQANLLEKSLTMQVNLANSFQGSNVWPSTAVPPIDGKPMVPPSTLLSDVSQQSMITSTPKKRKMVTFDMVPWYKEVNHEPSRLQIICMAGSQWAHASHRIQEVKHEAEIVEDAIVPMVRAKRRLMFTTELMQQVFRPPPAAILHADATDCDSVAHFTARLALRDACSLTIQLPPDSSEVSPDKLQTPNKASASDFSKVVEILVGRVEKVEDDLSRMDKSLSLVDIKVENQELEKFAMINRFAKFHLKAQQTTAADPASSGTSSMPKTYPQRYVIPHPMPRTVPTGIDCLSL